MIFFKKNFIRLGNKTIYKNTFQLLPNHLLSLSDNVVKRYFPREEKEELNLESAIEKVHQYFTNIIEAALSRFELKCSITSGWDSRIVTSLTKGHYNSIEYYTFKNPPYKSNHPDLKISKINCLHMHIGSNLKDFSSNIEALEIVVRLAHKINKQRLFHGIQNVIQTIDIGGGIDFEDDDNKFSIQKFIKCISKIPGLMENFKMITEFGTCIHRSNSFVVSNIEYVIKNEDDLPELIYLHVGADMFVRKVYSDMKLNYPISVLNYKKSSQDRYRYITYDIVGPLCFAGDVLFKNIQLKEVNEGDKLFIYYVGANTISMWSGHCNRNQPDFFFV